jgi:hypothetical protein
MPHFIMERGQERCRPLLGASWLPFPGGSDGILECGVFLLGPGVPASRRPERVRCAVAILPGSESAAMGSRLDTPCAVTYGLSSRDTVTLSSLSGREAVIALQREVIDLTGCRHERQEWTVAIPPGLGRLQMLAVEAARIVKGEGLERHG